MFRTDNTISVGILCFEEDLDSILRTITTKTRFQFRDVKEDKNITLATIDQEKVGKIDRLTASAKKIKETKRKTTKLEKKTLDEIGSEIQKNKNKEEILNELSIRKEIAMLRRFLGKQGDVYIIEGWIPKHDEKSFVEKIRKCSKNTIVATESGDRNAPVIIDNPCFIKPFEYIIRLYNAPKYGEIDPTPILALTFSTIFGIMSADLIDGLVIAAVSAYLFFSKKIKAASIGIYLGLSSSLFGVVFGEALGGLIELKPILFNPFEEPFKMLYLSIGIGIIHLLIGHILGFINKLKDRGVAYAIESHISFILILLAFPILFLNQTLSIVLIALGIVLLLMSRSIEGIVELPSIIGNIVSYSRILAINLAHIGIAKGFTMLGMSINNPIFTISMISFGHFILLTLGLIIAFVHTLRLHFVEFFTKFMGAGEWFSPYLLNKMER